MILKGKKWKMASKIFCDKCGVEIEEGKELIVYSPHQTDNGTSFVKEVMCENCGKVHYPYFMKSWDNTKGE